MRKDDLQDYKPYYELTEIRRTGFSRLSDLDGLADRLAGFVTGLLAGCRAVAREIRRLK